MPHSSADYFAGKTIVITGAASGIGRANALIFAREKANVICADIAADGAAATAAMITDLGAREIWDRCAGFRA